MLQEAIETIESMAIKASGVKIVAIPGDPTTVLIDKEGSFSERPVPPPARKHQVERIEDLCAYVPRAGAIDFEEPRPSFWHSDELIVALLDDGDRRDVASLVLVHSPQWRKLRALGGQWLTQHELVRLLKVDFDQCLDQPAVIEIFHEVKFRNTALTGGTIQHGRESLGREIEGEVKGAGVLPEEISVTVPVYWNPDLEQFTTTVRLALEVNYGEGKFSLTPFPDELHNGQQFLHDSIRDLLRRLLPEGTLIVQGKP